MRGLSCLPLNLSHKLTTREKMCIQGCNLINQVISTACQGPTTWLLSPFLVQPGVTPLTKMLSFVVASVLLLGKSAKNKLTFLHWYKKKKVCTLQTQILWSDLRNPLRKLFDHPRFVSVAVIKTPWQFRRKEFIWLTVPGYGPPLWGGQAGAWSNSSHDNHSQKKRERTHAY